MGSDWVSGEAQVDELHKTNVSRICWPIWGRSGIRMDLKWGVFTWASHVGAVFLKQYGAHTIFPVYAHARFAHLHPLYFNIVKGYSVYSVIDL